jgi:hypothetical protein
VSPRTARTHPSNQFVVVPGAMNSDAEYAAQQQIWDQVQHLGDDLRLGRITGDRHTVHTLHPHVAGFLTPTQIAVFANRGPLLTGAQVYHHHDTVRVRTSNNLD